MFLSKFYVAKAALMLIPWHLATKCLGLPTTGTHHCIYPGCSVTMSSSGGRTLYLIGPGRYVASPCRYSYGTCWFLCSIKWILWSGSSDRLSYHGRNSFRISGSATHSSR